MDKGLIPRRYAKALYEFATEKGQQDAIYSSMQQLEKSFVAFPDLAKTLANPFIADSDKTKLLEEAAGNPDNDKSAKIYSDFIALLAQNKRMDCMRSIAKAYIDIYREDKHIFRVEVTSASQLTDEAKDRLDKVIRQNVGSGTLDYNYAVDPSLIGGFTVTVDSRRLDASIAGQLKKLRLDLVK